MSKAKKTYLAVASIAIVAAAVAILFAVTNTEQPSISILNKRIEPAVKSWNNQTLLVTQVEFLDYWKGNFNGNRSSVIPIGSYLFDYPVNETGSYLMYFVNEWENKDPVNISLAYGTTEKKIQPENFLVPYRATKQIELKTQVGDKISGNFNVTGHPDQGIPFYLIFPKCSQSISFSFALANTGSENGPAHVQLNADGVPIWFNRYYVGAGTVTRDMYSTGTDDCSHHSYDLALGKIGD